MNKKTTLTVQQRRPNSLPADDWSERQEAVQRQTLRGPHYIYLGNGNPMPCGTCFPEQSWLFAFTGGSYNVLDDQGNVVGTIDDNGVLTVDGNATATFPVVVDAAAVVAGSTYVLPSDPLHISDVWFDYLYAKRDIHWSASLPRTISVISPITTDTVVRVAYVTK